jgi:hypothetical protein
VRGSRKPQNPVVAADARTPHVVPAAIRAQVSLLRQERSNEH